MTIFGRSPNLVLSLLSAVLNAAIVFHIAGFNPDAPQIATLNVLLFAIVAVISNTNSIAIAAGNEAAKRVNGGQ